MEEPPYAELQREVQRKLGRCLIRIQQFEHMVALRSSGYEVLTPLPGGTGTYAEV